MLKLRQYEKKYYDEKFDYNLSLINKKTLLFLKYAWKDANHPDVVRGGKMQINAFSRYLLVFFRYGAATYNYLDYQFYRLNSVHRDRFLTLRRRIKLMQTKFDFETYVMFKNKQQFNCTFKEYLNRDWLFLVSIYQK